MAAVGDNAGHTGKDMIFEIRLQPEGDSLMITRGGVYCRHYRIWFRPNHVLGFLLGDKVDLGPVREKARAAVPKQRDQIPHLRAAGVA